MVEPKEKSFPTKWETICSAGNTRLSYHYEIDENFQAVFTSNQNKNFNCNSVFYYFCQRTNNSPQDFNGQRTGFLRRQDTLSAVQTWGLEYL